MELFWIIPYMIEKSLISCFDDYISFNKSFLTLLENLVHQILYLKETWKDLRRSNHILVRIEILWKSWRVKCNLLNLLQRDILNYLRLWELRLMKRLSKTNCEPLLLKLALIDGQVFLKYLQLDIQAISILFYWRIPFFHTN
jgi:hypothetical protein